MQHDDPNDRAAGGAGGAGYGGTGSSGMGGAGLGGGGTGGGTGMGSEGMSGAAGGLGGGGQSAGSTGRTGQGNGGTMDSAREGFETVRETVRERAHEAGERTEDFRHRFADRLQTGAERLKHRASGAAPAGEGRLDRMLDTNAAHRLENGLASGLESTADWIRNADLDSIRNDIEGQVRNNPGRTLLVALGIGYLVGRAFGGGKSSKSSSDMGTQRDSSFGSGASTHGLH